MLYQHCDNFPSTTFQTIIYKWCCIKCFSNHYSFFFLQTLQMLPLFHFFLAKFCQLYKWCCTNHCDYFTSTSLQTIIYKWCCIKCFSNLFNLFCWKINFSYVTFTNFANSLIVFFTDFTFSRLFSSFYHVHKFGNIFADLLVQPWISFACDHSFSPFFNLQSSPQLWKRFCRYAGSTMIVLCQCSQILTRFKWNWLKVLASTLCTSE